MIRKQFLMIPLLAIALLAALWLALSTYRPSLAVSLTQAQAAENQDHGAPRDHTGRWNWHQRHASTATHPLSGTAALTATLPISAGRATDHAQPRGHRQGKHDRGAHDHAAGQAHDWNGCAPHAPTETHSFSGTASITATTTISDMLTIHNAGNGGYRQGKHNRGAHDHAAGQMHDWSGCVSHALTETHSFSGTAAITSTRTISEARGLHGGASERWHPAQARQHGREGNWHYRSRRRSR